MDPIVFERGDSIYIVSTVSPIQPNAEEVEEYAFADQLRKMAPSDHLLWLRGQYVEADVANANGQMWSSEELSIKSMTPNFMPVTVMHDPRTAVGLIADTKLLTPDKSSVPRSRIDTSLAIWKHRFPEIAEECMANYSRGELMQSMECKSPWYECGECGQVFHKLPPFDSTGIGKERAQWCDHLNENARRILGNVVFTGTGLIFGTRGSRGANDKAHLEVFQEEVAEYHEKAHRDTSKTTTSRRKPRMDEITIPKSEYDALQKRPTQDALDAEKARADTAVEEKETAIKASEEAEAAKVKAEEEKATLQTKVEEAEETARKADLAKDRLDSLGDGFKDKIGKIKSVNDRLEEQASTLSDEDWKARLDELAELTGVKSDAAKDGKETTTDPANGGGTGGSEELSAEEVAASLGGGGGEGGDTPARKDVVGGLFASTAPGKKN